MAETVEKFTRSCLMDIRDSGTRLVIAGGTGVGKTHCAERVARYVGSHQIDAWKRRWWQGDHIPQPVLLRWHQEASRADWEWSERMEQVTKARLVVVDDVGAETDKFKNDVANVRLLELFEAMRPPWKWMLITTNVPPPAWKTRWDQRIADRMLSCARIDMTSVPSFRIANQGHAK